MIPRVVVVGLGPAGPDLLTAGTLDAIEAIPHRYLRTIRHPAAAAVAGATSFDDRYDDASTMDEVYAAIVDELVSAALAHGEVLYAVPGSPAVAEHTVELLLIDDRVEAEVHPALSFLDLAWVRLGVDPVAVGARLVDGHRFAVEAAGERGPLLVGQCDRPSVLSDIKLAVEVSPELPVTVLARLGLPDEAITEVAWDELDREVEPDHLTSLWIPELSAPVAGEVQRFDELVVRLRAECPWDREQTHRSLAPHLLEEAHEVHHVLSRLPEAAGVLGDDPPEGPAVDDAYDDLEEELGDLFLQIVLHARLASEAGRFTLADVARGIHDKMVSRHPHVFGQVDATTPEEVRANWEVLKRAEKPHSGPFDGIPTSLPSLSLAAKILTRAERHGLDVAAAAGSGGTAAQEIGRTLLDVVAAAVRDGVDAEGALRATLTDLLAALDG